jgi:hypothetical protein
MRAARQSREARIRFWRVFMVSSFFVVMLGANLFVGAVVIGGRIRAHAAAEQAAANGRTAQIRRPLLDGTFCRNIVFDNNSAQTIADKVERCDQLGNKPGRKSKANFSWGGK